MDFALGDSWSGVSSKRRSEFHQYSAWRPNSNKAPKRPVPICTVPLNEKPLDVRETRSSSMTSSSGELGRAPRPSGTAASDAVLRAALSTHLFRSCEVLCGDERQCTSLRYGHVPSAASWAEQTERFLLFWPFRVSSYFCGFATGVRWF